jgi:hypothetical protein
VTTKTSGKPRVEREARLQWVPIPMMKVSQKAQRDLQQHRVDKLVAEFDLEELGTPTVNLRDGTWYLIDGQHRIETLKQIGYGDQQVQCWCYEGLTEKEEADKFTKLNNVLTVNTFAKYRVGLTAGYPEETEIDAIVRSAGLHVAQGGGYGAIAAIGTLRRVYARGPGCLARTLCIIRDAYGDPGLESAVIDGIGLLLDRYNGDLSDDRAIKALGNARGGLKGLLGKAEILRQSTHSPKAHCVAAAAVEMINHGRGGRKLPSWWRAEVLPDEDARNLAGGGAG